MSLRLNHVIGAPSLRVETHELDVGLDHRPLHELLDRDALGRLDRAARRVERRRRAPARRGARRGERLLGLHARRHLVVGVPIRRW